MLRNRTNLNIFIHHNDYMYIYQFVCIFDHFDFLSGFFMMSDLILLSLVHYDLTLILGYPCTWSI